MNGLHISRIIDINEYWLVYRTNSGGEGYIDLSASANTFEKTHQYTSDDGLRCVGLRYTRGGSLCYELFNIGHPVLCCPARPDLIASLIWRLQGKDPAAMQRALYDDVEARLNAAGWKTVEE